MSSSHSNSNESPSPPAVTLTWSAAREPAEQQLLGERALDVLLDDPRHRAGAHESVEAVLGEPCARFLVHIEDHALFLELPFQLDDELVDHVRAMVPGFNDANCTMESRRFRNSGLNIRRIASRLSPE